MRFHVGFSFRPKNILKFLVPILIGIGAYFGFGGLFGFIQVKADVSYSNYYIYDIPETITTYDYDLSDDADITSSYTATLNNFINTSSTYYYPIVSYRSRTGRDLETRIYLLPKEYTLPSVYVYGWYGSVSIVTDNFPSAIHQVFFSGNIDPSSTKYIDLLNCYVTNTDCDTSNFSQSTVISYNQNASGDTYNSDYTLGYNWYRFYYLPENVLFSEDTNLYNNPDAFIKSLKVNDVAYNIGSVFPTYSNLYITEPIPPDPPEPPEPETPFIGLAKYIYWFEGYEDNYGVLVNIYTIVFIYCITSLIVKFIAFVRGIKKW